MRDTGRDVVDDTKSRIGKERRESVLGKRRMGGEPVGRLALSFLPELPLYRYPEELYHAFHLYHKAFPMASHLFGETTQREEVIFFRNETDLSYRRKNQNTSTPALKM